MDRNTNTRTLMQSSTAGRYAIQNPDGEEGRDLTSGQPLDMWDGQQWREGRVERDRDGYYFTDDTGFTRNLSAGLIVRVR